MSVGEAVGERKYLFTISEGANLCNHYTIILKIPQAVQKAEHRTANDPAIPL